MASWCETKGYNGAAAFLYAQAEEEKEHMLKLMHYLNDRGGYATLQPLEAPETDFGDLKTLFEKVLAHEEFITARINDCYEVAMNEKDFNSAQFLQWYIEEQVEEESSMNAILDKIRLAGDGKGNLFHIDKELENLAAVRPESEGAQA
jgi:ferritin